MHVCVCCRVIGVLRYMCGACICRFVGFGECVVWENEFANRTSFAAALILPAKFRQRSQTFRDTQTKSRLI